MEGLRQKVIRKGKEIEDLENNDLNQAELLHINKKLQWRRVPKDFQSKCMSYLEDDGMPVHLFLAKLLQGSFNKYGETEMESEKARTVVEHWSERYIRSRNMEDFMRKLAYNGNQNVVRP